MQLNAIRGREASGKTTKLRQLARDAGLPETEIINADFFQDYEIELLILNRIAKGAKAVFINDCYEATISHLERNEQRFPADLIIHVVVRA